eukprot:858219-Prymnesium_polylepis.1
MVAFVPWHTLLRRHLPEESERFVSSERPICLQPALPLRCRCGRRHDRRLPDAGEQQWHANVSVVIGLCHPVRPRATGTVEESERVKDLERDEADPFGHGHREHVGGHARWWASDVVAKDKERAYVGCRQLARPRGTHGVTPCLTLATGLREDEDDEQRSMLRLLDGSSERVVCGAIPLSL